MTAVTEVSATHPLKVVGVTRPNFLLLPPICVALALAVVLYEGSSVEWLRLIPIVLGALAAHVAVNAFNEHADFHSGLDFRTERTPFSGGSGTLVTHPELAPAAAKLAWLATLVTVICGLWLLLEVGLGLLPFGLIGLALVLSYSGPISRHRWWVLIAPGLGFGIAMVLGTAFALSGQVSVLSVSAALLVFFLVSNLLLLNQFPDREADASVGRDNVVIRDPILGTRVYGGFLLGAGLSLVTAMVIEPLAGLAVLPLYFGWRAWRGASQFSQDVQRLLPAMGANVVATLATPSVLALVLLVRFFLNL
ncbi:MAG: prenyltransferase [Halieaceae bacterium]|jgi:1,4-dihydroxy-2-naphthoate octaprenyltransferase|nr:prenyltransferase [Halieaceae bacterium]